MYSGKYSIISDYLSRKVDEKIITLTFEEIEDILQFKLPSSAYKYNAWWANEQNGSHSHAHSWLSIGWKTSSVELGKQVSFIRQ